MTVKDKLGNEEIQYNINKEVANISTLSSG